METKIMIITSTFLAGFIRNSLEKSPAGCEIQVREYTDFDCLARIYRENEEETDGFLISGISAVSAIRKSVRHIKKPVLSFQADLPSLYRLLLDFFLEEERPDPRRVIFDFLLPVQESAEKCSVDYFLRQIKISDIESKLADWLDAISYDSLMQIEMVMMQKISELWSRGAIDMVICAYSSLIPFLESSKIPYRFHGPSQEQVQKQIEELKAQIEVHRMRENLPAVIAVTDPDVRKNRKKAELFRSAFADIRKGFPLDVIIQEEQEHYYIYTSAKIVSSITDEFKACRILPFFHDRYGLDAFAGYGIGYYITEARKNAENALKESLFAGGSFVMDEQRTLLGPLNSRQYLEIRQDDTELVYKIARQCRLSTLTIQKLLSILHLTGSSKITTHDLARHMNVTVRNASRILQNLEKGGAAAVAYTQSTSSKGRPVKVYELSMLFPPPKKR